MDSCSGAGMAVGASSCPRSLSSWKRGAGTQRGEWGGASHALQDGFLLGGRNDGWGAVVPAKLCPRGNGERVPRGGKGAGPPTRHRDGFLLGGRNDGWGRRRARGACPRGNGERVPRGGNGGRASHAPQGWIPASAGMVGGRSGTRTSRQLTTPAKAGVHSVQALRQAQDERGDRARSW